MVWAFRDKKILNIYIFGDFLVFINKGSGHFFFHNIFLYQKTGNFFYKKWPYRWFLDYLKIILYLDI